MSTHNGVYEKLAEKYRLVGDTHFREILEALMTSEEGKYLLELATPQTPAFVAQHLRQNETLVAAKMDNLARRGLLFRGKTQYLAWGDAHQLKARVLYSGHEYIPPQIWEIRRHDMRYAESPYAEINIWFWIYAKFGSPLLRLIPARKAIAANPNIRPNQVLWYEDIVEMMRRSDKIGVVECNCRNIYHRCDKPVLSCLHFGKNVVDYEVDRGGRMKTISLKEAIAISDEAEEAGLVHSTPGNNASLSGVICNCCTDCCSTYEPALQSGRLKEVSAPSRFRAVVNQDLCKGCQQCFKRCPFGAIEIQPAAEPKKQKAIVLEEKCMGCGVCVLGCKNKALTFELVRPPEYIPPKPTMGQPLMFSTQ